MKRICALFLALALVVSLVGCSGGVSQEEYDVLQEKYSVLEEEYNDLNEAYSELEMSSSEEELSDAPLVSFKIAGKVFSEEATVAHINDSIIQVTIPYPKEQTEDDEDFRKKLGVLMQGVGLGLLSTEYDSCLAVFVENGECYMGATFKNDGSTSMFAIEE